jgi:hypothetical protein
MIMTIDLYSVAFFLCYIAVTTAYGFYMRRIGVMQGINETLITLSESKSEVVRDALKTLEARAERHFRE